MLQKIIRLILENHTIIIHRHVRPDPDALGSQHGLATIIQESFPEKRVYTVGEEDMRLQFIGKSDEIPDEVYQDALVLILDTANRERISDERYTLGKMRVKIDHHPTRDTYAEVVWVDATYAATSEMIYQLYIEAKPYGFRLSQNSAEKIFAGIIGDTGRFLFPSTTKRTFETAMGLLQTGMRTTPIYDRLYETDMNILRLNGYIMQNFERVSKEVLVVRITKEVLDKFGLEPIDASNTTNEIGNLHGVKAWVTFIEESKGIRVRLRSKGPIVSDLAAEYHGGGHKLASGATIDSWDTAKELVAKLIRICDTYCKTD